MNEREAFEAWLLGSYGKVYSKEDCDQFVEHGHVSWLSWKARAAVEADRAQRVPDWSHPKVQALIGSDARKRIQIDLFWRILENPNDEFGPSDMEYWDAIHDRLKSALLASTPAPTQQSGWTEEFGLVLEAANRAELACYEQGSDECMSAVQEILDGKDRGDGVANEPWESIRRRLIALVAPAPAQQEPDWWRKRADEIEVAVARSGSTEAMRCFTDMRTLLQAAAKHQEPPQQERKPMTDAQAVKCIEAAGFKTWTSAHFRLVRQAERHHEIKD